MRTKNRFLFSFLVLASITILGCGLLQSLVPTATSPPEPTFTPTFPPPTSTPKPAKQPTKIPTPTPFVLEDDAFQADIKETCKTDVKITDYTNGSFATSGTLSMINGNWALFCYGAKHSWVGTVTYAEHTFDSDAADPLQFTVTVDGYLYLSGTGTITLPDGTVIELPLGTSDTAEQKPASLIVDPFDPSKDGDYPTLASLATESEDFDNARIFEVTVHRDDPAIFFSGWCTTTEAVLEQNLEHSTWTVFVDYEEIPLDRLHLSQTVESDKACQTYMGIVREWSGDEHLIETYITFDETVNDGWDDYPPGEYGYVYRVTVIP